MTNHAAYTHSYQPDLQEPNQVLIPGGTRTIATPCKWRPACQLLPQLLNPSALEILMPAQLMPVVQIAAMISWPPCKLVQIDAAMATTCRPLTRCTPVTHELALADCSRLPAVCCIQPHAQPRCLSCSGCRGRNSTLLTSSAAAALLVLEEIAHQCVDFLRPAIANIHQTAAAPYQLTLSCLACTNGPLDKQRTHA